MESEVALVVEVDALFAEAAVPVAVAEALVGTTLPVAEANPVEWEKPVKLDDTVEKAATEDTVVTVYIYSKAARVSQGSSM